MSRNKINFRMLLCFVAMVLLALILWGLDYTHKGWFMNNEWFLWLFLIPAAGIFYFKFQDRCPHCGEFLGRLPLYAKCCPHCGEHL